MSIFGIQAQKKTDTPKYGMPAVVRLELLFNLPYYYIILKMQMQISVFLYIFVQKIIADNGLQFPFVVKI